jgi:hypothetical protein
MGAALPPVELVRVEDIYFVQDGHHRISVARAMGQTCIEAEVVVWQVARPLSWQPLAGARYRVWASTQQKLGAIVPSRIIWKPVAGEEIP